MKKLFFNTKIKCLKLIYILFISIVALLLTTNQKIFARKVENLDNINNQKIFVDKKTKNEDDDNYNEVHNGIFINQKENNLRKQEIYNKYKNNNQDREKEIHETTNEKLEINKKKENSILPFYQNKDIKKTTENTKTKKILIELPVEMEEEIVNVAQKLTTYVIDLISIESPLLSFFISKFIKPVVLKLVKYVIIALI